MGLDEGGNYGVEEVLVEGDVEGDGEGDGEESVGCFSRFKVSVWVG